MSQRGLESELKLLGFAASMKKLLQTCGSSTKDQWIPGGIFFPGTSIFLPLCCSLQYKIHELLYLNPLRNNPLLPSELLNPGGAPSASSCTQLCTDSDCPQHPLCPREGSPPRSSWQAAPWSTQPMFVHYPFPFGCCLGFVSSSPLIQEAGASSLILHIQFSALPATTTNVLSQKRKKKRKKKRHGKLSQSNLC